MSRVGVYGLVGARSVKGAEVGAEAPGVRGVEGPLALMWTPMRFQGATVW